MLSGNAIAWSCLNYSVLLDRIVSSNRLQVESKSETMCSLGFGAVQKSLLLALPAIWIIAA